MSFRSRASRRVFMAASGIATATLAAVAAGQNQSSVPLAPPDKQPPDLKLPQPVGRKIGYAVVGLGQLALEEVMPAFGFVQVFQTDRACQRTSGQGKASGKSLWYR